MYRQFRLRTGHVWMMTWLKDDERLQKGTLITLKEIHNAIWEIEDRFEKLLEHPPDTSWKVGGLMGTIRNDGGSAHYMPLESKDDDTTL